MRARNMIGVAAVTLLSAVSLLAQDGTAKPKAMRKKHAATAHATTDTAKAPAVGVVHKDSAKLKTTSKKP